MKTISIIFNDKGNVPLSRNLYKNLEFVFGSYIEIKALYLDDIEEGTMLEGDIFLVLFEDRIYQLKNHVGDLSRVIAITRTINKKYMPQIMSIPAGTDVLIVNDSYESTVQTANTFYELGINHINLIPYNESLDAAEYYENITIAITPNEEDKVPLFIKNIINIGDRYLDMNTLLRIINKLQLNNEAINRNLIKYMQLIAEPEAGAQQNFVNNYLHSKLLKLVIHKSAEGILMCSSTYGLIYSNDAFDNIFNRMGTDSDIRKILGDSIFKEISDGSFSDTIIKVNSSNYFVEKHPVMMLNEIAGYCITFKNERDIRDLGRNLDNQLIKNGLFAKYTFEDILYASEAMEKCISLSRKAALTDYTVIICGESGTGKELIAQSIHNYSGRKSMAFVAVNCAAMPESLLESELFGYENGAFTGARKNGKLGLFEQSNRGTIFLDEIGDMPLNLQSRLLRVLQEKQIMRIGSDKIIDIDVRIIAATNKDLEAEVEKGNFRKDLYYRLNIIPVTLPPLRDRKSDVSIMLKSFLKDDYGRLNEEQQERIAYYNWPGNVRELKNAANYYKTVGELPENIMKSCTAANSSKDASLLPILKIIRDNTKSSHGIGRSALIYEARSVHRPVSDSEMRTILDRLNSMGLITIGKGRTGSRITEEGVRYLDE